MAQINALTMSFLQVLHHFYNTASAGRITDSVSNDFFPLTENNMMARHCSQFRVTL